MTVDHAARIVQLTYPQVYFACHTRHQRKRSTEHRLSQRDSAILVHLDSTEPIAPSELARHLEINRSTMSEALKKLVALGFVKRARSGSAAVLLTEKGLQAIADTSVLETARLQAVLTRLPADQRSNICRAFERLARACRETANSTQGTETDPENARSQQV
jgi:MarR family transcriptional regulator, organic hydroperoxide resistance regulator